MAAHFSSFISTWCSPRQIVSFGHIELFASSQTQPVFSHFSLPLSFLMHWSIIHPSSSMFCITSFKKFYTWPSYGRLSTSHVLLVAPGASLHQEHMSWTTRIWSASVHFYVDCFFQHSWTFLSIAFTLVNSSNRWWKTVLSHSHPRISNHSLKILSSILSCLDLQLWRTDCS